MASKHVVGLWVIGFVFGVGPSVGCTGVDSSVVRNTGSPGQSQAPDKRDGLHAPTPSDGAKRLGVDRVTMVVSDLSVILPFYRDVLTFVVEGEPERAQLDLGDHDGLVRVEFARLRLGDESIELIDILDGESEAYPADSRSNDLWFQHLALVVADMDAAHERLRAHRVVNISESPQTIPLSNPNAGGIRAFYFRDPDGHPLELIYFPEGRGSSRWHGRQGLFLGIDHTAIAVTDTETSIKFYRGMLGLEVAGTSHNTGIEQARLSGVPDADVVITGLRGAWGMGVELLEYRHPGPGRAHSSRSRRDLTAAVIVFSTEGTGALATATATATRDPDGHFVRVEPRVSGLPLDTQPTVTNTQGETR